MPVRLPAARSSRSSDNSSRAPDLTLAPVEGTDDVRILLDGQAVGLVAGGAGLSAEDITLLAA